MGYLAHEALVVSKSFIRDLFGLVSIARRWHLPRLTIREPKFHALMGGIKSERLLSRLEELASIGARSDGGVCRLAFSDEDLVGREYVITHLKRLGLEIRIDAIGNLFGILRGQTDLPAVMIGSHTDTVAAGGKYDGALGVLAALEAVECIVESGSLPQRSVIVASFVNEEGVRFMPDMMGSLIYCGRVSLEDACSARDTNGITIGEELDRLSYAGSDTLDDIAVDFFLELHMVSQC